MSAQSEEFKFAKAIEKGTERIGLDYNLTVMRCLTRNSAVQEQMFDLVLSFIAAWSHKYESGAVEPHHRIYRLCEMSHKMMSAINRAD